MTEAVQVLSAGSMRHAFPAIIEAYTEATGIAVSLSLGPAGLLRERIEAGERFDLFASANMEHPRRLAATGVTEEAICFTRNRLCVITRADLGMTTENFLDVLSDSSVKIGTSTPGDDPSGDYAFEVFDRIETRHPGMGTTLKARARQLVGGRNSPPTPPGKGGGYLITDGEADLMMSYYSNARLLEPDPAFRVVDIPAEFSPKVEYGLGLRKGAPNEARRLQDFVLSKGGQEILRRAGFLPVSSL
ncbi:molybdate ABC transporter substrate-binding protein [Rhizobium jaguaris]|uniref:molybdate ABC transporter substrate-binding protein n=1 Tax=Rhizobium jaguaris TaxID=1312183 RepID=UPI0039BFFCAF